jgi:DNA-binding HxlR family transcriptional regulator
MGWDEISNSVCPIARALALVGDRWTLLILLEVVRGMHRFDELQAQTGMSSHLLSTRLKRMEEDGLLERRQYSERPPRSAYHATAKGKELDPLLLLLRAWGRKWEGDMPAGKPATTLRLKGTDVEIDTLWDLPSGGKDFTFDLLDATPGPAFAAERARRSEAFYGRAKRTAGDKIADDDPVSIRATKKPVSSAVKKTPVPLGVKKAPVSSAVKKAAAAVPEKKASTASAAKKATAVAASKSGRVR